MLKIDRNKGFFNNTKPSHDATSTANGFALFVSETNTVLDILESDYDTSFFVTLLHLAIEQSSVFANLFGKKKKNELDNRENITIFAPTNAALENFWNASKIPKGDMSPKVAKLLLYHIIAGNKLIDDIFDKCDDFDAKHPEGICDSIPTFTNLISQASDDEETNSLRIHPSMDNDVWNINAAQIIKDKADQIADNGVVHFVDEVCMYMIFPLFEK